MRASKPYLIGELGTRTGVSPDTIRYYERVGVLPEPARTRSGYRMYDDSDVERLEFVQRAQALDLTLDEIGEIVELTEAGVEPCDHVRESLRRHLSRVERRIGELRALRERLREALATAGIAANGSCRCEIIDRAVDTGAASRARGGRKRRDHGGA